MSCLWRVRSAGHSLVDVLTGVVLLGALSSIVLLAGGVTGRDSKEMVCLNNLRRIGYANLMYAAEDAGNAALPVHKLQFQQDPQNPTFIGAYEWGGKAGRGEPGYRPGPGGDQFFLTSRYGTMANFGPSTRPLNPIIYPGGFKDHNPGFSGFDRLGAANDTMLDLPIFRCPSDSGYTGNHCVAFRDEGLTSYDHYGTSYNANNFMTSFVGGGPIYSNSPYLHRLSDIRNPKRTVAYQENAGRFAWAAPEPCDFLQPGLQGTSRGWHGKDWTFNAAFIDGHADTIYMRSYTNPKIFEDVEDQEGSRCIIIRGDRWQLDTLPTPRISTGLFYGGENRPSLEGCGTIA